MSFIESDVPNLEFTTDHDSSARDASFEGVFGVEEVLESTELRKEGIFLGRVISLGVFTEEAIEELHRLAQEALNATGVSGQYHRSSTLHLSLGKNPNPITKALQQVQKLDSTISRFGAIDPSSDIALTRFGAVSVMGVNTDKPHIDSLLIEPGNNLLYSGYITFATQAGTGVWVGRHTVPKDDLIYTETNREFSPSRLQQSVENGGLEFIRLLPGEVVFTGNETIHQSPPLEMLIGKTRAFGVVEIALEMPAK